MPNTFRYDPEAKPEEIEILLLKLGVRRSCETLAATLGPVGMFCLRTESGPHTAAVTS
jgi:hypothetical protein